MVGADVRVILNMCALAALTGAAGAGDEWQNVTLDRGITMDVPAAVHNYRTDEEHAKQGQLAFFAVSVEDFGDLFCDLGRSDYQPSFSREMAAAALADRGSREALCSGLDGWTNVQIGESDSRTSNGYSAAHCASAYTKASDKLPGHVSSVLAIAAPDGFYQFNCTLDAENQSEATAHWVSIWSPNVKHMEESIRLGK
jgi:hypothetical protein